MRLAFLSDLHLSRPGPSCAFTSSVEHFAAVLARLSATHDLVVLAGDVFDHDVGPNPFARGRELSRIKEAWSPIVTHSRAPNVQMIAGNHDSLQALSGVPSVLDVKANGRCLRVLHGHQLVMEGRVLAAAKVGVKWVAGGLYRVGRPGLGDALYRVNALTAGPLRSRDLSRLDRLALQYLSSHPEVDILVCGHSHEPRVIRTPSGVYANAGGCSFGHRDLLTIDLDGPTFTQGTF